VCVNNTVRKLTREVHIEYFNILTLVLCFTQFLPSNAGPTQVDSGPGSSVGIATDYELDGPGSNPGGDEIFRPSRPDLEPTQPPVIWVPGLSRG
jgi:hypothetical protein